MSDSSGLSPEELGERALRAATVGTARQAVTIADQGSDEPLSALAAAIVGATATPELAVLRLAALAASSRRAGFMPPATEATVLPEAAAEDAPCLAPGLSRALGDALSNAPLRTQAELLQRVHASGLRLPPAVLPTVLDAGRRQGALRPAIAAVLGARGRWLAALNEDWRYAIGVGDLVDHETRWQHGNLEERVASLRTWREQEADAARERLAAVFASLPARERAALLGSLATGLAPADGDWLARALTDRSTEVVDTALSLLRRIEGTAHSQRAAARLAALVSSQGQIDAPESFDPTWKADGIDGKRPRNESLGDRAWWLYQLARQVPASWWRHHLGRDTRGVLALISTSDWREAVQRASLEVALADADAEACAALLHTLPAAHHPDLLARLPIAQREHWWLARIGRSVADLTALIAEVVAACGSDGQLSAAFGAALASRVASALATPDPAHDFHLKYHASQLIAILPVECLSPILAVSHRADADSAHLDWWRRLATHIELRLSFAALPSHPSSAPRSA